MGHYLKLFIAFILFCSTSHALYIPDRSVTNKKLAAYNYVASDPIQSSTTTTGISILSSVIVINSSGRPIKLKLAAGYVSGPTLGIDLGSISIGATGVTSAQGYISFQKGASELQQMQIRTAGASGTLSLSIPCSAFEYTDFSPTVGSNTYNIRWGTSAGATISMGYCRLVASEI